MKHALHKVVCLVSLVALSACATMPTGPMVRVMPGPNKPFEVFVQDQNECRGYASSQVAGEAERQNNRAVGAAVLTT
ncbi:MAG: glycine zipper family protein, partial [Alphaproteobacteria bacterium]